MTEADAAKAGPIRQVGMFALVGMAATGVHYLVALALSQTVPVLWANPIGFVVAFGVSYIGHGHFTFALTQVERRHRQRLPRFALTAAVGFLIGQGLLLALHTLTPFPDWLILGLALSVVPVITFIVSRAWVFSVTDVPPGTWDMVSLRNALLRLAYRKPPLLLAVAGVVVAVINGAFFINVYWLNADDVMFLQFSLQGMDAVIEAVTLYATVQGRFGQLIQMPLNILAAYLSQYLAFRVLTVALFFGSIWFFLAWFDRALQTSVRGIAFILCAALTALHFYHLPPTSFPLQNTVPYLVLTLSRIALLRWREAGMHWKVFCALIPFSLAMAMSEYAFLFGTGMLAVEYLSQLSRKPQPSSLRAILKSRALHIDFAACLVPLALYVGWRVAFPSAYDGNSLDGLSDPGLALRVWFLHAFSLNGLALPQGWTVFATTWTRTIPAVLAAAIVLVSVFFALPRCAGVNRPYVPMGLALFFALYVTLPTSMTLKQQQWCTEQGACVFLDSRTAFPAAMLVLVFMAGGLYASLSSRPVWQTAARISVSLLAAVATALTLSHNSWMTDHMDTRMAVWRHANDIACDIGLDHSGPRAMVDPLGLVDIHPHLNPDDFWIIYGNHRCGIYR